MRLIYVPIEEHIPEIIQGLELGTFVAISYPGLPMFNQRSNLESLFPGIDIIPTSYSRGSAIRTVDLDGWNVEYRRPSGRQHIQAFRVDLNSDCELLISDHEFVISSEHPECVEMALREVDRISKNLYELYSAITNMLGYSDWDGEFFGRIPAKYDRESLEIMRDNTYRVRPYLDGRHVILANIAGLLWTLESGVLRSHHDESEWRPWTSSIRLVGPGVSGVEFMFEATELPDGHTWIVEDNIGSYNPSYTDRVDEIRTLIHDYDMSAIGIQDGNFGADVEDIGDMISEVEESGRVYLDLPVLGYLFHPWLDTGDEVNVDWTEDEYFVWYYPKVTLDEIVETFDNPSI